MSDVGKVKQVFCLLLITTYKKHCRHTSHEKNRFLKQYEHDSQSNHSDQSIKRKKQRDNLGKRIQERNTIGVPPKSVTRGLFSQESL